MFALNYSAYLSTHMHLTYVQSKTRTFFSLTPKRLHQQLTFLPFIILLKISLKIVCELRSTCECDLHGKKKSLHPTQLRNDHVKRIHLLQAIYKGNQVYTRQWIIISSDIFHLIVYSTSLKWSVATRTRGKVRLKKYQATFVATKEANM